MEEPRFESLGPERFQAFCQSLLSYEEPDLQALPVGQPDGGRDAFRGYTPTRVQFSSPVVFQVKFVRKAMPLADPVQWLEGVLKTELPKIERLARRGTNLYRLITNAPGSAHLDTGAVDKVNAYLAKHLPIPAECWWRNDLAIRLAKYPELRWAYPDLLTPTDILRELIGRERSEDSQRRTNAIQAFLSAQYKDDRYVRFRQVELQHDLLNAFIDVPTRLRTRGGQTAAVLANLIMRLAPPELRQTAHTTRDAAAGAAEVLTHPAANRFPHVVIEGAPGQGKSTLAQYICQLHRMRLLRRTTDLRRVPKDHISGPLRLPFKIDLRDLAAFLRGDDPFEDDPAWSGILDDQPRTVEGFLTGTVRRYSGGAAFDVSDLQMILSESHALFVFDGLDEVGDLSDRRMVVEAIDEAKDRLEGATTLGVQSIVTSRPAVFGPTPGFSVRAVPHLQLVSITQEQAMDYSERWASERKLSPKDKRHDQRILAKQLSQAHIRDLARNPMQLAILLNLIRTKGESVPDRRTELYTGYMQIFFDRESEKSDVVRDTREPLIEFHEYMGWMLHADAERNRSSGGISESDLRSELAAFLVRKEKDPDIVESVFHSIGRVMALTERVQGRFEFEVQPVREYFAAAFLYKTAQLSTGEHKRPGDLPARFDGLARAPFWLNVVRFYAGFYNSGQLPSLVQRLRKLQDDRRWTLTGRARLLATLFLRDWSFAPDPESRRETVALVLDGFGTRYDLSAAGSGTAAREVMQLPEGASTEELLDRAWELLDGSLPRDRREAVESVVAESQSSRRSDWIDRVRQTEGEARTEWLRMGWIVGLFDSLAEDDRELLWSDEPSERDLGYRAAWTLSSGLAHEVEFDEERSRALVTLLVERGVGMAFDGKAPTWLTTFGMLLQPSHMYEVEGLRRFENDLRSQKPEVDPDHAPTVQKVRSLVEDFQSRCEQETSAEQVIPSILEEARQEWGEGWGLYRSAFALIAAEGRPRRAGRAVRVADPSAGLHRRLRYARSKGGASQAEWWATEVEDADSPLEKMAIVAAALSWASKQALAAVLEPGARILDGLSEAQFQQVCRQIEWLCRESAPGRTPVIPDSRLAAMPDRLAIALAHRDPLTFGHRLYRTRYQDYRGRNPAIVRFALAYAFEDAISARDKKSGNLALVRRCYRHAGQVPDVIRPIHRIRSRGMSEEVAEAIMKDAAAYPIGLVKEAERVCSMYASVSRPSLYALASEQEWFAGQL